LICPLYSLARLIGYDGGMSNNVRGSIRAKSTETQLDRALWRQFIGSRPEFRRQLSISGVNPFSGTEMTVSPRADSAEVIMDNRPVGNVWWSMSDVPMVNISVQEIALPLVLECAKDLNAEFHAEDW
jgi:hypothetical protein